MYLDGRLIGVIAGMFLYGAVSQHFYKKVVENANVRSVSIYLLIVQGIVFSFVRMQFAVLHYAIAFFVYLFVFKPQYHSSNKKDV